MIDLSNTTQCKEALESYSFRILPWELFVKARKPDGLLARARKIVETNAIDVTTAHVVFDPIDNEDGFMLVGDEAECAKEACEHIMESEPDEGPLA